MLSKNKIKFIQSLSRKKIRDKFGLFVAEGDKLIHQLQLANFKFHTLVITEQKNNDFFDFKCEKLITTYGEIKKISSLKTPPEAIAICYKRNEVSVENIFNNDLILVLDNIQDPGNLGTIFRIASWFGIKSIVCSLDTVDCYNPKTIQATMGAIAYIQIRYTNLIDLIKKARLNDFQIYGTFLDGKNIYQTTLKQKGLIILGNEGNGISSEIENEIEERLYIPSFSDNNVESLNVSVAASIVCSEFRRRNIK